MLFRSSWLLVVVLAFTACGQLEAIVPDVDPLESVEPAAVGDWSPVVEEIDGLTRFSRTEGEKIIISTGGGERDFLAGVNVGATVPGTFPGELAVDAETYRLWFKEMANFGFTSMRIYTMLPPHFYEELRRYNLDHPRQPLYLIHGAWPPEEEIVHSQNFYAGDVITEFKQEISDLVDVTHGNAVIAERPGRAHGTYEHDVSSWVLGWAVGIEWDAPTVLENDTVNADRAGYEGKYFRTTSEVTATESWMAIMLDHLATQEAAYGNTMPVSFVNWVTTDPLAHPEEPLEREDLVSVDPMHVEPTDAWPGGYFAGYHVYSYYPDFQRYERGIFDYVHNGKVDPYAGLLTKYAEHHAGVPFVVLEFGVPTGMAKAHEEPLGRNQGDHTEQEQAQINADMLNVIAETGMAGGYVFAWTDEWFKLTWNTFDYELSERRPVWMNAWTNEAHFGLIASEPGLADVIVLDGDGTDWDGTSVALAEGRGNIREVRAAHDEGYLYLRVITNRPDIWQTEEIQIGFDVIDGRGTGIGDGRFPEADYRMRLIGDEARIEVRSDADPMLNAYKRSEFFPESESVPGRWNLHRLITNRPFTLPDGTSTPVEIDPAGILHQGTSDPNADDFDSRATWLGTGDMLEIRVPWQAIGFADPSSRFVFDVTPAGVVENYQIEEIRMAISLDGELTELDSYTWEPWNQVRYTERVKAGSAVFAETVIRLSSRLR